VSVPRFFEFFFIIFLIFFLIFKKKSKYCRVSSCHRAMWQCQSDMAVTVTRVSIMPGVISLVSIWSLYFNLSQFSPNFCKNVQFCAFQIETKINFI